MPTFNQLVKKGRQTSVKKSTAPALQSSFPFMASMFQGISSAPFTILKCFAASRDRKSTRLNSSHVSESRMPSSA